LVPDAVSQQIENMAERLGWVVAIDYLTVDVPDPAWRVADANSVVVTAHFGITYRIGSRECLSGRDRISVLAG